MRSGTLTGTLRNFIGGEYVEARAEAVLDLVDPATEEVYGTSPVSTAADIDAAYRAASDAFETWGESTPAERQLALFRIADAMEARAEEFADLESQDTGKPRATLVAAVWKVAPAIAAGNTVVLKPSDTTPLSTLKLAEVAAEFLPAGVLNVVTGDRATGAALLEHPAPQMVAITGSVRAGMEVAKAAASDLKRVHLELGGKAPAIVFPDTDLQRAAAGVVVAAYFNAGQDCTAATRVIVHESVHDEFVNALVVETRASARTGGPREEGVLYGPLNNRSQLAHVSGFIDRLPSHAEIAVGGRRQGDRGYFWEATVVTGLHQDDEAVQREIFGPVLTVQSFRDDAEALSMANGVEYALAASMWTSDHGRAMRFAKHLDFGCVWINTHIPFVSDMPHGGFKHSGYGKDLSNYGFEDYTRIKHVMSHLG